MGNAGRTKKRRLIIATAALVSVAVAVTHWPREPRPCRATFEQVREGMTIEEVCVAVGGPPGDYSGGYSRYSELHLRWFNNDSRWLAQDAQLGVEFNREGRVSRVVVTDAHRVRMPSLLDRLRIRLGV
jgi:hypothetical protein